MDYEIKENPHQIYFFIQHKDDHYCSITPEYNELDELIRELCFLRLRYNIHLLNQVKADRVNANDEDIVYYWLGPEILPDKSHKRLADITVSKLHGDMVYCLQDRTESNVEIKAFTSNELPSVMEKIKEWIK